MRAQLVQFIISNVNADEMQFTYGNMAIERCDLSHANYKLYNRLSDLVDDFLCDNELSEDWFEENFIDIEDLFECVLNEI